MFGINLNFQYKSSHRLSPYTTDTQTHTQTHMGLGLTELRKGGGVEIPQLAIFVLPGRS